MPGDEETISLRLPRDAVARLKTAAKDTQQSVEAIITKAAQQFLDTGHVSPDFDASPFPEDINPADLPRSLPTDQRNRIADWVSLTHLVLGRFHLRLVDVEDSVQENPSFVGSRMEKRLIVSVAVTALGTYLYGERASDKVREKSSEFNTLKKQADALSAYILGESLFYSTRGLPENHALMACIGEGAMPKAGETPEEGANPQIAFGRIFARPEVATWLQEQVRPLLDANVRTAGWDEFWSGIQEKQHTVWGAAIDTLENTTRFTRGGCTGPMVVLHVFDQPLLLASPFESYVGMLTVPKAVSRAADEESMALNFLTPRRDILKAIRQAYPNIPPERIHVWTLGGASRKKRISVLWNDWAECKVDLVNDGWQFTKNGLPIFRESGTYAPIYRVGVFDDDAGQQHLFLCDGYAASAEALQAASLDPVLDLHTSLCMLTSVFREPYGIDRKIMQLDPSQDETSFQDELSKVLNRPVSTEESREYLDILGFVKRANVPASRTLTIDDFFPNKRWRCLALSAMIMDDPYAGIGGIQQLDLRTYQVTVRIANENTAALADRTRIVKLTVRMELPEEEQKKAFYPLLERFYAHGDDYETRPVKSSDVARILNELRTLSWNCVVDLPGGKVRVNLESADEAVISRDKKEFILSLLRNYKRDYPFLTKHVLLPEDNSAS